MSPRWWNISCKTGMPVRVRFLHTSDWQLGVTRHVLDADAQARWTAARFEGIRKLGAIAADEKCEFIVVVGNIFGSNQVDQRQIARAWWGNQKDSKSRPQAHAWLSAGFLVDTVNQGRTNGWARFKRQ